MGIAKITIPAYTVSDRRIEKNPLTVGIRIKENGTGKISLVVKSGDNYYKYITKQGESLTDIYVAKYVDKSSQYAKPNV